MKKKNTVAAGMMMLALAAGATGALAYYSAQTNTAQNEFNIVAGGSGSGDEVGTIDEIFDASKAQNLEPRSTFTKEAKLNSNVDYTSYGYLLVTVPNINARLKDQTALAYRDAVDLDFDSLNWTLVKKTDGDGSKPTKYLYRYKNVIPAGAETGNLFTKATVPDYVESEGVQGSIDVTGYMLSSINVTAAEADQDAINNFFN